MDEASACPTPDMERMRDRSWTVEGSARGSTSGIAYHEGTTARTRAREARRNNDAPFLSPTPRRGRGGRGGSGARASAGVASTPSEPEPGAARRPRPQQRRRGFHAGESEPGAARRPRPQPGNDATRAEARVVSRKEGRKEGSSIELSTRRSRAPPGCLVRRRAFTRRGPSVRAACLTQRVTRPSRGSRVSPDLEDERRCGPRSEASTHRDVAGPSSTGIGFVGARVRARPVRERSRSGRWGAHARPYKARRRARAPATRRSRSA